MWKITHLVFEKDESGYARERDEEIAKQLQNTNVKIVKADGHSLWNPVEVVKANHGKPPITYNAFLKVVAKLPKIQLPLETPSKLPPSGEISVDGLKCEIIEGEDMNAHLRINDCTVYGSVHGVSKDFSVPTMEELGYPEATTPIRGGEKVALERMENYLQENGMSVTGIIESSCLILYSSSCPIREAQNVPGRISSAFHDITIPLSEIRKPFAEITVSSYH